MQFSTSPALLAAIGHRPSPPVRRGAPAKPPQGGKAPQDATIRQQLFEQAVWDIAQQTGNAPFPARFQLEDEGLVWFDQGCIDMARDWLHCEYSQAGWPTKLLIKPEAWVAGRPMAPDAA